LQGVNVQVDGVINVLFEQIETRHFVDVFDYFGLIRCVAQLSRKQDLDKNEHV